MKKKVISRENMPIYAPVNTTAIAYLLLDKFQPLGWVWGIVVTLIVLFWLGWIYQVGWLEEDVNIFEEKP